MLWIVIHRFVLYRSLRNTVFLLQAINKTRGDCEKQKAIYFKNRAACFLKMERFEDAVDDCTKSLELIPNDPKALFRRCQAYEALNKVDSAYADAKEVHNLDPKN